MIGATGSTTTTIFEELDEQYHRLEVKGKEVAIIETTGAPLTQSIWALAPDELVRHLGYAVARGAGGAYGLADVPVRPSASNAGQSVVQVQKGDGTLIGFESAVFKAAVTEFVPGLAVPGLLVVARDGTNYHVQLTIDLGSAKILHVLISSPGLLDAQQVTLDEALDVLGLVARPLAYEVQQVDVDAREALAATRGAAKTALAPGSPLANTLRLLSGPAGRQVLDYAAGHAPRGPRSGSHVAARRNRSHRRRAYCARIGDDRRDRLDDHYDF